MFCNYGQMVPTFNANKKESMSLYKDRSVIQSQDQICITASCAIYPLRYFLCVLRKLHLKSLIFFSLPVTQTFLQSCFSLDLRDHNRITELGPLEIT